MNTHFSLNFRLAALLAMLCLAPLSPASEPSGALAVGRFPDIPDFLIGDWLITGLYVDRHFDPTGQPEYDLGRNFKFPNDPTDVGRIFRFTREKVSINVPGLTACRSKPNLQVDSITVDDLIRRSFHLARSPQDFGLSIPLEGPQKVIRLRCEDEFFSFHFLLDQRPDNIEGSWILRLRDGKLAMRWESESILTLEKFEPSAHAKPSFDCAKAKSVSEQAICASPELALYDLSVAEAYRRLKDSGDAAKIRAFAATQKKWLAKRENCKQDKLCLADTMLDRVIDIQTLQHAVDLSEPWEGDVWRSGGYGGRPTR